MSTFDATGLTIDRKPEITEWLSGKIKGKWGDDHRTDPESATGQLVEIFSEIFANQNELILSVATIYQPSKAFGVWLSEIVKLNGIERKESAKTVVPVEVEADPGVGTTVFAGDLVTNAAGDGPFAIDVDTVLVAGETKTVSATSTVPGAIEILAGTMNKILTPRIGWLSVGNASAGTTGRQEEQDPTLKHRRKRTAAAVGTSTTTRLYDQLLNDENINEVKIIENAGSVPDTNGVPPQHVWCIIFGGQAQTIAEIIYSVLGAGSGSYGGESHVYADTVRDLTKTINWDYSVDAAIQVNVRTRKNSGYPTSGDTLMKDAIKAWFDSGNVRLGGTVARGDLYAPAYTVPGHQIQDLYLGLDGGGLADSDIILDPEKRATVILVDITITEVS